jgi:hypothetical protein
MRPYEGLIFIKFLRVRAVKQLMHVEQKPSAINLEKFKYEIFPTRLQPGRGLFVSYNRSFEYWASFWSAVMVENGATHAINHYEFLKTDFITVVSYEDKPIAMLLHSLFNFEQSNIKSHPYLSGEKCELFFKYVEGSKARLAMSVEYMTVDRNWRKSRTGVSLGKVMFGLGTEIQKSIGVDVSFSKAREDVKVSETVQEFGGIVLEGQVDMHNTPVAFIVLPTQKICTHPDLGVASLVKRLWAQRRDHSEATTKNKFNQKAA